MSAADEECGPDCECEEQSGEETRERVSDCPCCGGSGGIGWWCSHCNGKGEVRR